MIRLLLLAMFASSAQACLTVPGDRVLARDLAKLEPAFASLDPGMDLTFTPFPGTQRVLSRRDLTVMLTRHGIAPSLIAVPSICIERETEQLNEQQLIAAVRSAIHGDDVHIRIVDYPHQPMPRGQLQFKLDAVAWRPLDKWDRAIVWPGRLMYDEGHSFSVWVKAMVWLEHSVVVAATDLAAGKVIPAESLRLEQLRQSPFGNRSARAIEQVVGFQSRSPVRKGSPLSLSQLELPWMIFKGDKVLVRVLSGPTHVSLEAQALSSGRVGDEIALENPMSGRIFRAVVEAKGLVSLHQRGIL